MRRDECEYKSFGKYPRTPPVRSLTQQQLADVLGVTVGAVYKWEASLSAPDLTLLVELADLFDTSVDVLLGYNVKSNNPRGINDDVIGQSLVAFCNRPEEAVEYLSTALVSASAMPIRIANGFLNVYFKRDDYASGASILKLALDFFAGLKLDRKSNMFDKPCVSFLICLAHAQLKLGKPDDARASLLAAKKLAEEFDRDPDYSADSLRFISAVKQHVAFDTLDSTAAETAAKTLKSLENESLSRMWEEITPEKD